MHLIRFLSSALALAALLSLPVGAVTTQSTAAKKTTKAPARKTAAQTASKAKTSAKTSTKTKKTTKTRRRVAKRTYPGHYTVVKNVVLDPMPEQLPDMTVPLPAMGAVDLKDSFGSGRSGGRTHHAIDIFRPIGTPIYAVAGGTIEKLFRSGLGGIAIYHFDEKREFCFYYAHLSRYADDLHEGQEVKRGDLIGYVGQTGNARFTAPHLHFAITKLDDSKAWWKSAQVYNPYPVLMKLLEPPPAELPPPVATEDELSTLSNRNR